MLIPSPNGSIPWRKRINAREIFKVPDALINFLAKIKSIYSIPSRSLQSILTNILRYHVFECNPLHKYIQEDKEYGSHEYRE